MYIWFLCWCLWLLGRNFPTLSRYLSNILNEFKSATNVKGCLCDRSYRLLTGSQFGRTPEQSCLLFIPHTGQLPLWGQREGEESHMRGTHAGLWLMCFRWGTTSWKLGMVSFWGHWTGLLFSPVRAQTGCHLPPSSLLLAQSINPKYSFFFFCQ